MSGIYQNCVVAFVDLLGFKEALKFEENAQAILTILHQIKKGENSACTVDTKSIGSTVEIKIQPTITVFSDNMVISVSENIFNDTVSLRHAVIEILNIIQQLANLVIQKGFLLRGGMTVGSLYHADGIVFGPALVEAYELESQISKHPRILASSQLIDNFNADKNGGTQNCFLQDVDEHHYLDYLPTALTYSDQNKNYQEIIEQKILVLMKKSASDERTLRILEKWFWFEKYYRETIEKIAITI